VSAGQAWGYQIRKYPDSGLNRHADTGVMAKSFFSAKAFHRMTSINLRDHENGLVRYPEGYPGGAGETLLRARCLSNDLTIGIPAAILKCMLDQAADLDQVFHALADPGRRVMVERLSQGPASVSELGRPLDMSLAAVLQHVQVLEASGLIRSQKAGRTRTCSINPVALRSAEDWIAGRRTMVERRLDRLGTYLAQAAGTPDPAWSTEPGRTTSEHQEQQ
jgi:DNA-binding transcriptional ArsR family regulator